MELFDADHKSYECHSFGCLRGTSLISGLSCFVCLLILFFHDHCSRRACESAFSVNDKSTFHMVQFLENRFHGSESGDKWWPGAIKMLWS